MMRINCAVPDSARINAGSGRWSIRSWNLPQLHGARAYSAENRPPTLTSKYLKVMYMMISARRKLGTAMPMNPTRVKK